MEQQNAYRPFMPMLMLAAAVAVWFGFTTMQLIQDRDELRVAGENQQALIEQSQQLRSKVKVLADKLDALRAQGNRNAADILGQLEKQGINLGQLSGTTKADETPLPE